MEELQKLLQLITRTQLKWQNIHIFILIGHLTIYKKYVMTLMVTLRVRDRTCKVIINILSSMN